MTETEPEATEKEIELNIKDEVTDQKTEEPVQNNEPPPKKISALSPEERELIINNAKNNIDMNNYKVTVCKNGEHRITAKKAPNNVASKVIASKALSTPKQAVYTDSQLLMEHIIELNGKYERLQLKQKKLKKKYRSIHDDVYAYDEPENISPPEQTQNEQPPPQQLSQTNHIMTPRTNGVRGNWRNGLTVM